MSYWFQTILIRIIDSILSVYMSYTSHRFPQKPLDFQKFQPGKVIELENTSHPAVGESQRLLVQTMVEDIQL